MNRLVVCGARADADAQQRFEAIETAADTMIKRSEKVAALTNRSEMAMRDSIDIADEVCTETP